MLLRVRRSEREISIAIILGDTAPYAHGSMVDSTLRNEEIYPSLPNTL